MEFGIMLTTSKYEMYLSILRNELVMALGCTEPIAVAYAAATAARTLAARPERVELWCSGNIVKNVKGVVVPNTGNLKGIDVAAIAGIVGGDPERGMQVLESVTDAQHAEILALLGAGYCTTRLIESEDNLFIVAKVFRGEDCAEVHIKESHTNIHRIVRNGEVLFARQESDAAGDGSAQEERLSVRDILEFAESVDLDRVRDILDAQIEKNTRISEEGLRGQYGMSVGKTLLKYSGSDVRTRAKARAAAGSDARMSGCSLPVVINSGSGNQGITVSMPVVAYAEEMGVGREILYRALIVSNLVAIHQKNAIGKLSAFCGAVSAACGSGAAITYMARGGYEAICKTITNTVANVGGIVCDGAKPSCAAKIASAVDAAIMAHHLSAEGKTFSDGEGVVTADIEQTIANIGRIGGEGMRSTDLEILRIMVDGRSVAQSVAI